MTPAEILERMELDHWLPHQLEAFAVMGRQRYPQRLLLHHRTGAGKTTTALACVALAGAQSVLVLAPPSTHSAWEDTATRMGLAITVVSHAKFRQRNYQLSRKVPVIVDEFHLLGGHEAAGWRKMDRIARSLEAPLVLASATPNYNDVERVYCIQHMLAPQTVSGGYLQFLYSNCDTRENPFARTPEVVGFRDGKSAEEYLSALPYVVYLPDITKPNILEYPVDSRLPEVFTRFNLDTRGNQIMASQIEISHKTVAYNLLQDDGHLWPDIREQVDQIIQESSTPVLIFLMHSSIVGTLMTRDFAEYPGAMAITGATTKAAKEKTLNAFRAGNVPVLVGTATLATGTDGLDKVCDTLIILDNTPDDSLRKQLIGRIMPRGVSHDATKKKIHLFVPEV